MAFGQDGDSWAKNRRADIVYPNEPSNVHSARIGAPRLRRAFCFSGQSGKIMVILPSSSPDGRFVQTRAAMAASLR